MRDGEGGGYRTALRVNLEPNSQEKVCLRHLHYRRPSVLLLSLFFLWKGWNNMLKCLVGVWEAEVLVDKVGKVGKVGKPVVVTDLEQAL